jgi:4-amino-4-deoxy-L-arabinose transferase-like glycosyltransferase
VPDAPHARGRYAGRTVLLLVTLALVARLTFVAATPDYRPRSDDHDYDRLGCAILTLGAYPDVGPRGTPTSCRVGSGAARRLRPGAYRPPVYPAFLAGIYWATGWMTEHRWTSARVAQAVLGAAVAWLVGLVAWQLWGRAPALVALAIAAVWLPLIVIGAALFSETLFVALMLAAVASLLALRRSARPLRWALLAGLLVGLAALTRSNGAMLLLPLALGAWLRRPHLRSPRAVAVPAALVVTAIAVIAPWTIRTTDALGAFVPISTELGGTLAGTYNPTANADRVFPAQWKLGSHDPGLARIHERQRAPHARDRALLAAALRYVRDHPSYPAKVAYWNARRLFGLTSPRWWRFSVKTLGVGSAAGVAAALWLLPFLALAALGALTPAARRAPPFLWLTLTVVVVPPLVIIAELRFRAPVDPFVILLAALAICTIGRRAGPWVSRRRRAGAAGSAAGSTGAAR